MIKAVGYARFSSANQSELSIEAQIEEIKKYCEQNNYILVKTYIDKARSGTNTDREQFQQMIMDAKKGLFDVLVVHKLDRFARNRYDAIIYSHELEKYNVKLESVVERISDDPAGILVKGIFETINEFYSLNLSNEVKLKMKKAAELGYFLGGIPPLGYDLEEFIDHEKKVRKKYVINESEAVIVRFIFESYANGMSMRKIVELLNRKGYKTKRGNAFQVSSVSEILRNEKYGGFYTYNKGKHGTRLRNGREDMIRIPGLIPAIVDKEIFDKVQKRLKENKVEKSRKHNYLLKNIIYCGDCGSKMIGYGGSHPKYVCHRWKYKKDVQLVSIGKKKVENYVISYLKNIVLAIEKIDFEILTEKVNNVAKEKLMIKEKKLEKLLEEQNSIEKEIENIIESIAKGILVDKLEKRAKDLEKRLEEIKEKIVEETNKEANIYDVETIKQTFEKFRELINSGDELLIEQTAKTFIEKIMIYPGGYIEIIDKSLFE